MTKLLETFEASSFKDCKAALLEAPTGTGKTLALLCATLSWQHKCRSQKLKNETQSVTGEDAVAFGGGFVIDKQGSETNGRGEAKEKKKSKKSAQIIYTTRTHSQIAQVRRELRKSKYLASMATLASRKHYCTNKVVAKRKGDINEACKALLKDPNKTCQQNLNVQKLRAHPSLKAGGEHHIHDIEDLVELGHEVKGCAYFASRQMAQDADIVFCPYTYILNPVIRRSMEVDLNDAIIIFDEAHNIEDEAREAASFSVDFDALNGLHVELQGLVEAQVQPDTYQPLDEIVEGLVTWMQDCEHNKKLEKLPDVAERALFRELRGRTILDELKQAGISIELLPTLVECSQKAVKAAIDAHPGALHLTGHAGATLDGLFTVLGFMLRNEQHRLPDYRVVLLKPDEGQGVARL
eukprot:jgi/Mesen1/10238/ME000774S09585